MMYFVGYKAFFYLYHGASCVNLLIVEKSKKHKDIDEKDDKDEKKDAGKRRNGTKIDVK